MIRALKEEEDLEDGERNEHEEDQFETDQKFGQGSSRSQGQEMKEKKKKEFDEVTIIATTLVILVAGEKPLKKALEKRLFRKGSLNKAL